MIMPQRHQEHHKTRWGYDPIMVKVIPSQMNMEAPIIIPEDPSLVQ